VNLSEFLREKENLFAKKLNTIIILRITKYNVRLPEGVLTPSKLAAYVNLNNKIESTVEKASCIDLLLAFCAQRPRH